MKKILYARWILENIRMEEQKNKSLPPNAVTTPKKEERRIKPQQKPLPAPSTTEYKIIQGPNNDNKKIKLKKLPVEKVDETPDKDTINQNGDSTLSPSAKGIMVLNIPQELTSLKLAM